MDRLSLVAVLMEGVVYEPVPSLIPSSKVSCTFTGGSTAASLVLQEFYVQATRSTRPDRIPHDIATGLIRTWMRFAVQEITVSVFKHALEIKAAHGFSYWDSAIIAAARALGCRELYSEDMADGREVEGLVIIDPFR